MKSFLAPLFLLTGAGIAFAQVPDRSSPAPAPAASSQPASSPSSSSQPSSDPTAGQSKFLGKDIPLLNMSNDVVTWDGKNWNVKDNALFRARFEKFLNTAEQTSAEDTEYQKILATILDKLSPANVSKANLDEAWSLLPKASKYKVDANLCDSLADAIYSVWLSKQERDRLSSANTALERERESLEYGAKFNAEDSALERGNAPRDPTTAAQWSKEQELKRDMRMQPYISRLAEVNVILKANQVKREANSLQAKIEFQALSLQFFFQRRFQHVLMASRFYRVLFGDGDTQLKVGDDARNLFSKTTGLPPTLSVLDSLANEAMRDVKDGLDAYNFLLDKKEMRSATEQLFQAFAVGENLPEVRSLPREKKRVALDFTQKTNQLLSALEVKDYALAEKIVRELESSAKDFDSSKATAAIETARKVSAMHLAKAKIAAASGDRVMLETELKNATEIWPRNPALAEVSSVIFSQADVQQQALVDLDRLVSQKNYRQIFDDKVRFIAATALYPNKQEQLRKVLDDMQFVESGIIRANEIAKRGDYAGAWESVETVFQKFPDDNKLNQVRADLTTQAADFVRSLRTAQQLEEKQQIGSSLAWYLKAQKLYPASDFARAGVDRLVKQLFDEATI